MRSFREVKQQFTHKYFQQMETQIEPLYFLLFFLSLLAYSRKKKAVKKASYNIKVEKKRVRKTFPPNSNVV
jgi:hypothetical protein